jgi:hypothetical protein
LQYLAAWEVHRGYVRGRCEPTIGIEPFGRLVNQVLAEEPYRAGTRLFRIVDNGSSHRGGVAMQRLHQVDSRVILVHTPVHASWLKQVDISFSIIQRKVLPPMILPIWKRSDSGWPSTKSFPIKAQSLFSGNLTAPN